MKIEYERDYFPVTGSIITTLVLSIILFAAVIFGRAVELTMEVATATKSPTPILDDFTIIGCVTGVVVIYFYSFFTLNYLSEGCQEGPFSLPYKLDYNYNKIPKLKTA